MSNWILKENERLDDLIRDGMKIIQRTDGFCFSIDSVLLAHYVSIKNKDKIADLGTGTGSGQVVYVNSQKHTVKIQFESNQVKILPWSEVEEAENE